MTERIQIRNPRTGEFDYEVDVSTKETTRAVSARLRSAQIAWRDSGLTNRIAVLKEWKTGLSASRTEIVAALTTDTGRLTIAEGEFDGLLSMIDNWCSNAPQLMNSDEWNSRTMPHVALRQQLDPFPVLGVISPWNFPLLLSFIDAIPALLAGCAVIIKPSEVTPRFAAPVMAAIAHSP